MNSVLIRYVLNCSNATNPCTDMMQQQLSCHSSAIQSRNSSLSLTPCSQLKLSPSESSSCSTINCSLTSSCIDSLSSVSDVSNVDSELSSPCSSVFSSSLGVVNTSPFVVTEKVSNSLNNIHPADNVPLTKSSGIEQSDITMATDVSNHTSQSTSPPTLNDKASLSPTSPPEEYVSSKPPLQCKKDEFMRESYIIDAKKYGNVARFINVSGPNLIRKHACT